MTLELSTGPAPTPTPKPPAPAPQKDTFDMDAKDFAALIAEHATKLANAEAAKATAEASATAEKTRADALATELSALKATDTAKQVTDLTTERDALKTQLDNAKALPGKLLSPLFAMIGQPTATLDEDEGKAVTQVNGALDSLKALGARLSGGLSLGSQPAKAGGNNAFKRRA